MTIEEFRAISEDSKKVGELENANRLLVEENQRLENAFAAQQKVSEAKQAALDAKTEEINGLYKRIAELERTANSVNMKIYFVNNTFPVSVNEFDHNFHAMTIDLQAVVSGLMSRSLPVCLPQAERDKVMQLMDLHSLEPENKITQTFEAGSNPTVTNL